MTKGHVFLVQILPEELLIRPNKSAFMFLPGVGCLLSRDRDGGRITCGSSRSSLCREAVEEDLDDRDGEMVEMGTESCLHRFGR